MRHMAVEQDTGRMRKYYDTPAKRTEPFSRLLFVVGALLALGVLAFVVSGGLGTLFAEVTGTVKSTPQSEWAKGTMPQLYQKDPQWSDHPYAEAKFGESGCGPTCLAMVNVFLTGNKVSPTDIADYATMYGYASSDGTSWSFMEDGAAALGLRGKQIAFGEEAVRSHLAQGNPIICIMGKGDFTSSGHFIVLVGVDNAGKILIRDSNSPERTAKAWNFNTLQQQCQGAWVYSA